MEHEMTLPPGAPAKNGGAGATDDWFCPKCNDYVDGLSVTHDELHEHCGCPVLHGDKISDLQTRLDHEIKRAERAESDRDVAERVCKTLRAENAELRTALANLLRTIGDPDEGPLIELYRIDWGNTNTAMFAEQIRAGRRVLAAAQDAGKEG